MVEPLSHTDAAAQFISHLILPALRHVPAIAREKLWFTTTMIDLRSDTVTRPTRGMRDAMAHAEVGDDVFAEDPSVAALEAEVARITGKEAALFVPSGTMGNQLAIACHVRPGEEIIFGEGAHPIWYECGGVAALSHAQFTTAGSGGFFTADQMEEAIKPAAYWSPRTALVCVENTHNRAGGRVFPQGDVVAIAERARARGLAVHLDGARIWNASIASGLAVDVLCAPFDTVSVCFSKGLGAPVGSALCGPRALVLGPARRLRKMWGGGMRQSGILAAAARYALDHHRARMADDHANATAFAKLAAALPGARVDLAGVETNIVNIDLDEPLRADAIAEAARAAGLGINASATRRLRAVTHLDVSPAQIEEAAQILGRVLAQARR